MYARRMGGKDYTFDFAANLFKDNLLFVDRETGSVWSQLDGKSVAGPMEGTPLRVVPSIQTTWKFWRKQHPDTQVMIAKGRKGKPYFYGVRRPGRRSSKKSHDTSTVGLGLSVKGQSMFFPLRELKKASNALQIELGGEKITVHYQKKALTAWAENSAGELLSGVIAYEDGWKRFYPRTRTFHARD